MLTGGVSKEQYYRVPPYHAVLRWTERLVLFVVYVLSNSDYYNNWMELRDAYVIIAHAMLVLADAFVDGQADVRGQTAWVTKQHLDVLLSALLMCLVADLTAIVMQSIHLIQGYTSEEVEQLVMLSLLLFGTLVRFGMQGVLTCHKELSSVTVPKPYALDTAAYTGGGTAGCSREQWRHGSRRRTAK